MHREQSNKASTLTEGGGHRRVLSPLLSGQSGSNRGAHGRVLSALLSGQGQRMQRRTWRLLLIKESKERTVVKINLGLSFAMGKCHWGNQRRVRKSFSLHNGTTTMLVSDFSNILFFWPGGVIFNSFLQELGLWNHFPDGMKLGNRHISCSPWKSVWNHSLGRSLHIALSRAFPLLPLLRKAPVFLFLLFYLLFFWTLGEAWACVHWRSGPPFLILWDPSLWFLLCDCLQCPVLRLLAFLDPDLKGPALSF